MNMSTTNAAIVTGLLGCPKRAPPSMASIYRGRVVNECNRDVTPTEQVKCFSWFNWTLCDESSNRQGLPPKSRLSSRVVRFVPGRQQKAAADHSRNRFGTTSCRPGMFVLQASLKSRVNQVILQ